MKKVDICDLCDAHFPDYKFQHRVKARIYSWYESYTTKYQICKDCWDDLEKKVKRKRKKHV